MERVLASCDARREGDGPASRRALRRFLESLQELIEAADALASPEQAGDSKVAHILWAGDDGGLSAPLQPWLEPNHRFHRALTREAALQIVAEHPPDLVLASASGLDILKGLRELRPGVPAIVLAGPSEQKPVLVAFASDPVVVLRAPVDAQELAMAVRVLLDQGNGLAAPAGPSADVLEAASYAHLAGLLPRALERALDFDAGAGVIARPGEEPLVDAYAATPVSHEALENVRDRALALFRLLTVGFESQQDVATLTAPTPFRSTLHVPIATQRGIVGVTYLVSSKANAFSLEDQRSLMALASHASGAYRRVENTARRLRVTPRQSQILSLIAAGLSDNAVAERLGVAHRTVRTHLDRLLREHGLHSRTEAVTAWLRGQQD